MPRQSPGEIAAQWSNRMQGASQRIVDGVQRVQTSPGQAAAAKQDKWFQGISDSRGKWARNTAAVPLEEWKDKMINVGAQRVAQGAAANAGKVERFWSEFGPHLDEGVRRVNAMPDATQEQRIQRAVVMMQHNAQFRRRGSGGTR